MRPVAILLLMAATCAAFSYLDQPWDVSMWTYGAHFESGVMYAEDFVAECDGALQAVTVWRYSMSGDPAHLVIQLWTNDPEGGPGTLLHTATFNDVDWDASGLPFQIAVGTVELPPTFVVSWGQTYWLGVKVIYGSLPKATQQPGWSEPCYRYMGEQWGPMPESGLFLVAEGTDLGLEPNTWGAIKASW